jgi:membrane protease YdiL (CAAX protease family)
LRPGGNRVEIRNVSTALKITAYLLGTILLGCLLAPPLFWLTTAVYGVWPLPFLEDLSFQRVFNRAMLISAVVLLWPVIKWLSIGNWRDLGLEKNPHRWPDLLVGFALAFFLLIAMGLVAYALEIYHVQRTIYWEKFLKVPLTMTGVSLVEEFFFRAALLGVLLRTLKPFPALVYISALYSIVHFLKPPEENVVFDPVTWGSGFALLPHTFSGFTEPLLLLGGFLTLFAIGMVLGYSRLWTNSLWLALGLHAGWIAGNRTFNILFKQDEKHPDWAPLWYGERIEIGLAPLITVILTGLLVALWVRRRHRDQNRRVNWLGEGNPPAQSGSA